MPIAEDARENTTSRVTMPFTEAIKTATCADARDDITPILLFGILTLHSRASAHRIFSAKEKRSLPVRKTYFRPVSLLAPPPRRPSIGFHAKHCPALISRHIYIDYAYRDFKMPHVKRASLVLHFKSQEVRALSS